MEVDGVYFEIQNVIKLMNWFQSIILNFKFIFHFLYIFILFIVNIHHMYYQTKKFIFYNFTSFLYLYTIFYSLETSFNALWNYLIYNLSF